MDKTHNNKKPGCTCADCLRIWDRRARAASELYALLGLEWIGLRVVICQAEMIRQGHPEFIPDRAQDRLRLVQSIMPEMLESILDDILD